MHDPSNRFREAHKLFLTMKSKLKTQSAGLPESAGKIANSPEPKKQEP
jgi:hypothetical protein